jgi:caa(3)-type oxidase subunit IV
VIVSLFTLRTVLTLLMFFTLLTVGLAQFEVWLSHTFQFEIPQWVNVAVALSIAAVKTALVVTYFMQLKYDNPMNTLVFVFTLLTVCFFLGFTMLDLGQRGTLDRFKSQYIQAGGTGGLEQGKGVLGNNPGLSLVEAARAEAKKKGEFHADHMGHHGPEHSIADAGYFAPDVSVGSSAAKSRPVTGVTLPGLPGATPAGAHGGHGEPEKHGDGSEHADHGGPKVDAKPTEGKPGNGH